MAPERFLNHEGQTKEFLKQNKIYRFFVKNIQSFTRHPINLVMQQDYYKLICFLYYVNLTSAL